MARLHVALLGDLQVHASTVGKLFTGPFEDFFQFLFGLGEFLLVKQTQSFVIDLELRLHAQGSTISHAPALRRVLQELKVFFFNDLVLPHAQRSWPRPELPELGLCAFCHARRR